MKQPVSNKPMKTKLPPRVRPVGLVAADAIDPAAQYKVDLAQAVTINNHQLLPLHDHQMRGDVLLALMQSNPNAVAASQRV